MTIRPSLSFLLFIFLFLSEAPPSYAQNQRCDSLLQKLRLAQTDTARLHALHALATELSAQKPDTALILGKEALSLAERLSGTAGNETKLQSKADRYKRKELALSNYQVAVFLSLKTDYRSALGYLQTALPLCGAPEDDELKCQVLYETGITYWRLADYPKAIECQDKALKLAEAAKDKKQTAKVIWAIGNIHFHLGDYEKAQTYFQDALKRFEELHDKPRIAILTGNLGAVFYRKGDYLKALDYDFKTLKIKEELKDKRGYAKTLSNVALVYSIQKKNDQALDYMFRALATEMEMNDKFDLSRNLGNIVSVYVTQNKFQKALNYNSWAMNLSKEVKDEDGLAQAYGNSAEINMRQADSSWAKGNVSYALQIKYPDALYYFSLALRRAQKVGDKYLCSGYSESIGQIQIRQGKYADAESTLLSALAIADSMDYPDLRESQHEKLSTLYALTGDYRKAYTHHLAYAVLKDTLFNKDRNLESSRKEMNFEYEKKAALLKAAQDKKDAIRAEEKQKQHIILYSVSAVLLLALSLSGFIYRSYLQKQYANLLLEKKNKTIERQKKTVEEKNLHITESIEYAKRIQEAILPLALFEAEEVSDHFILHLPKDIVSGDFYWRFKEGTDLFIAAVDCTGHGVPGAMMSMLGYDMLEHALKDEKLREPAAILQSINNQVLEKLAKGNAAGSMDGMDMTLCRLDLKTHRVTFAGARNDLYVVGPGGIQVYAVDKRSIGYEKSFVFCQQSIELSPGATVYLFSDGYADQKGGPEVKKYMPFRFRNLLEKISCLSCEEQKLHLEAEFVAWKGQHTQRDDVLVLGFKI